MRKIILVDVQKWQRSRKRLCAGIFLVQQAALQGHSDAQNNLADLYGDGKGVAAKQNTRRILVFEKRTAG